jgi:predicted membrane channel-forming protein YqfA (hemolysin III family)
MKMQKGLAIIVLYTIVVIANTGIAVIFNDVYEYRHMVLTVFVVTGMYIQNLEWDLS